MTRPGVTAAVHILSSRCENPRRDWNALKQVLKYLSGIKDYKVSSDMKPILKKVFSDADWVQDTV